MKRRILSSIFALVAVALSPGAGAGLIVASGDVTLAFHLTDTSPNPAVAGNGRFFQNVLGAGTQVVVLNSTSLADTEINEFYNSLPGVLSTIISTVTPAALSGMHLLLLPTPDIVSAAERSAMASFVSAGGSLFIMGDPSGSTGNVARVNEILLAAGSGMSLDNSTLQIGPQTASGSQIAVGPLTAGVTSLGWGSTAVVSGGTSLFFTANRSTFIAYEGAVVTAVPAPSSVALLVLALAGLASSRSRIRRSA